MRFDSDGVVEVVGMLVLDSLVTIKLAVFSEFGGAGVV